MNERRSPPSRHVERRFIVVALVLGLVGGGDFLSFGSFAAGRFGAKDEPAAGSHESLIAFTASEPRVSDGVGGSGGDRLNPTRIYVVHPDGSHRRALTGASLLKGSLAWSPDGSTLAFTTFDLDRMSERLSLMSSNGTERRVLCKECTGTFWIAPEDETCVDGDCPRAAPFIDRLTWSPDGRWLAAPSTPDGGLVVIEAATGDVHHVVLGPVSGTSWAPDSASVAVSVDGDEPGLYLVQVPTGVTTLLHQGDPYNGSPPAWSRDGSTIAFGQAARVDGDVYAKLLFIDADDGSSVKVLGTRTLFSIYDLEWSPSGHRLAVQHHPVNPPTAGLLTTADDGSDIRMVALCENGRDEDHLCPSNGGGVAWSPAGRKLAFRNYDGRRSAVSVLRIGGRAIPVSGRLAPGCCLAWSG